MRKNLFYYLSDFLTLAHPTNEVVDNTIQTKHNYLLIKKSNIEYLVSVEQYIPESFSHNYETGKSFLKIRVDGKDYSVSDVEDIIGCKDFDVALDFCSGKTDCLCTKPDEKLIFSPQLAKYLLKNKFRIIDIKPRKGNPNEIIPIFIVEDGFYDCIEDWKKLKKNKV